MSELPVETTLEIGWYLCDDGLMRHVNYSGTWSVPLNCKPLIRYTPAAEYRPAQAEPTGLAAVVKDAAGIVWVRVSLGASWPWRKSSGPCDIHWADLRQPVEVLSEGIQL